MDWPRLDTRGWNLALGVATTTVLGACGPFVTLEGETDTSVVETDTEPTDPTTTVECNNGSDCEPGYECIGNVCMPYDYYCGTGGCCQDGGCCYDDCCYGECYYSECYADEDCGPLGLCNNNYGYGYCLPILELPQCESAADVLLLPLPGPGDDPVVSLSFVDANGDGAEDLVVGRNSGAQLHLGPGAAPPISLPLPEGTTVVDVVSGDFDSDGTPDLAVTSPNRLSVLSGDGAGGFVPVSDELTNLTLHDIVALQWDGDGTLDLAGISTAGPAVLFMGSGFGSFWGNVALPSNGNVDALAPGNFDLDMFGDLVVQDDVAGQIFLGDGSGDVTPDIWLPGVMSAGTRQVVTADIDGDGPTDVVGHTPKPGWSLLEAWPNGQGVQQLYALDRTYLHAEMGDIDGDGKRDVVVGDGQILTVVRGTGNPGQPLLGCQGVHFVDIAFGVSAVGDFDGNGRADVVIDGSNGVTMLLTQ